MGQVTPWTDEQVENIRRWQALPYFHGLTCGQHGDRLLAVAADGLVCEVDGCDYRQEWVPTAFTYPPL